MDMKDKRIGIRYLFVSEDENPPGITKEHEGKLKERRQWLSFDVRR
jgi:hypothetical protein